MKVKLTLSVCFSNVFSIFIVLGVNSSERAARDGVDKEINTEAEEVYQRTTGFPRHHPLH